MESRDMFGNTTFSGYAGNDGNGNFSGTTENSNNQGDKHGKNNDKGKGTKAKAAAGTAMLATAGTLSGESSGLGLGAMAEGISAGTAGVGLLVGALVYFAATSPSIDAEIATPVVGTKTKDNDFVTIYKAPQNHQLALKFQLEGFHKEDFPRVLPYADGLAYFAGPDSRSLAMDYARNYGAGILQVTIPKLIYDNIFKRFERPYQGTGQTEIRIPKELFPNLNVYPRILTPY